MKPIPKNFCISPFISTRQKETGTVSPCAYGAGEWKQSHLSSVERWNSKELNELRQQFLNGEKPEACHKCWKEERAGKKSLRLRQYDYFPNAYEDYVVTEKYKSGPITALFKTSNICNLACRSCAGWDSSLYTNEGHYYAEKYKTYDEEEPHLEIFNRFIPLISPANMEFEDFKKISKNLEKIDFYGGEPLLNETHLELLEHLVSTGQSKNITLFYSTNTIQFPKKKLLNIWDKFKTIELSLSIDGVEKVFEYTRWPGKWSKCEKNIQKFINFKNNSDSKVIVRSATCFSILTLFDFKETYDYLSSFADSVYVNMINYPHYLNPCNVPDTVKKQVDEFYGNTHADTINYMHIQEMEEKRFKQFCIWMARQDEYRNQSLKESLPLLYNAIEPYWIEYTKDLSEKHFHQ